jgi:hypothetical protein
MPTQGGVRDRRGERAEATRQVGAPEGLVGDLLPQRLAAVAVPHLLGAEHEAGEVEVPLALARHVGAVDVAELAVEALVDHLVLLGAGEPGRVLVVVAVDGLEERGERVAELEAEPAAVAQVVDPGELLAEVGVVEVPRVERVVGGRHESGILRGSERARGAGCPAPLGDCWVRGLLRRCAGGPA